MGSPTDQDVKLADRLAAVEGAVARRDAIAEALADAFAAGQRHEGERDAAWHARYPLAEHPGAPQSRAADAWDLFAAAALGAVQDTESTDEDNEADCAHAARVADTMLKKREARRKKEG